jgi:hypothetical protein
MVLLSWGASAGALDAKAPGPEWVEARRSDQIVIYTRDDAALHAREVYAVGEADAPPAVVFAVVADVQHFTSFMPYVKEARILRRLSETDLLLYERLAFPIISDRDCVLRRHSEVGTQANGGLFRLRWAVDPDYFVLPRDGVVRLELSTGSWTLEPIDGGRRTRMTYQLITSPGGSIPSWMAEKSTTRAVPELFKAIKDRSAAQAK